MYDIKNLVFRATINNTRVLQESQHNFHSPQKLTNLNSPQSTISHSSLHLSPIIISTQSTNTNKLQMFLNFSNNTDQNISQTYKYFFIPIFHISDNIYNYINYNLISLTKNILETSKNIFNIWDVRRQSHHASSV